MRRIWKVLIALGAVYAVLVAGLAIAMLQPPAVFGKIMAKLPGPAFLVLPFQPMWLALRAGRLRIGSPAPDFALDRLDRSGRATLSEVRGRPVVLVFGSYT